MYNPTTEKAFIRVYFYEGLLSLLRNMNKHELSRERCARLNESENFQRKQKLNWPKKQARLIFGQWYVLQ